MTSTASSVLIGIPSGGFVHTDFMLCLLDLVSYTRGVTKAHVAVKQSSCVDMNRNMLAGMAIANRADAILFLDTDMTFPPNALERLLIANRAVVGAAYANRHEPDKIVGAALDGLPLGDTGLREMDYLGGGCLLARTSIFAQMMAPWFYNRYDVGNPVPDTEDVMFCRNVRKEGLEIWCDQELSRKVGHLGTKKFSI